MPANNTRFIQQVRDWSNRQEDQVSDAVISKCMQFAADTAYRLLQIPPLENSVDYFVNDAQDSLEVPSNTIAVTLETPTDAASQNATEVSLPVPSDAVSFIHVRIKDTRIESRREGIVFNEKTDTRTYHDMFAEKNSTNFWSRQGGDILATGYISAGDTIELYYYRRLADIAATYEVTYANLVAGVLQYIGAGDAPDISSITAETFDPSMYEGVEVPNWLRDENEKVLLFGTLWQVFDYVQDVELSTLYKSKFDYSIEELNKEEKDRHTSGGNTQIHFDGYGLI